MNASESSQGFLGYRAGSYDVTFSLRKGFCLVRHKLANDYGGRCGECLFSSKIGTKSLKDGSQDICEAKESNLRPVAGF